ncbi:hypothetical protein SNEBB_003854 [Seison nebaliae]|nr:hypothetical protein SNEBB_003854 [Seison nebaliae]
MITLVHRTDNQSNPINSNRTLMKEIDGEVDHPNQSGTIWKKSRKLVEMIKDLRERFQRIFDVEMKIEDKSRMENSSNLTKIILRSSTSTAIEKAKKYIDAIETLLNGDGDDVCELVEIPNKLLSLVCTGVFHEFIAFHYSVIGRLLIDDEIRKGTKQLSFANMFLEMDELNEWKCKRKIEIEQLNEWTFIQKQKMDISLKFYSHKQNCQKPIHQKLQKSDQIATSVFLLYGIDQAKRKSCLEFVRSLSHFEAISIDQEILYQISVKKRNKNQYRHQEQLRQLHDNLNYLLYYFFRRFDYTIEEKTKSIIVKREQFEDEHLDINILSYYQIHNLCLLTKATLLSELLHLTFQMKKKNFDIFNLQEEQMDIPHPSLYSKNHLQIDPEHMNIWTLVKLLVCSYLHYERILEGYDNDKKCSFIGENTNDYLVNWLFAIGQKYIESHLEIFSDYLFLNSCIENVQRDLLQLSLSTFQTTIEREAKNSGTMSIRLKARKEKENKEKIQQFKKKLKDVPFSKIISNNAKSLEERRPPERSRTTVKLKNAQKSLPKTTKKKLEKYLNITNTISQWSRTYPIVVILQHRIKSLKESNEKNKKIIEAIESLLHQSFCLTKNKIVNGQFIHPYDDRMILDIALRHSAVVISNDSYQDLTATNNEYMKFVKKNLVVFSCVNNEFFPANDPNGTSPKRLYSIINDFVSDEIKNNFNIQLYINQLLETPEIKELGLKKNVAEDRLKIIFMRIINYCPNQEKEIYTKLTECYSILTKAVLHKQLEEILHYSINL